VSWYGKKLHTDIAMIDKRRTGPNVAKAMNIVGDVKGKDVIIVDDMIDTGGTLVEAATTLKKHGAGKIYAFATHGIFSDPAAERLGGDNDLEAVIMYRYNSTK
jgi:ribose-phosphate pyrophosphokinase